MDALDELTGAYSRASILEKLDQAIGSDQPNLSRLVLVMMDIDHFKSFNDEHGHVAGDAAISTYAKRFYEVFKKDGMIGRYGGDEFIAAIWADSPNIILEQGEELVQSLSKSPVALQLDGNELLCPCSISLGMAVYPTDASNVNDLIDKARQALYRAKEQGGKTVFFYEQKDGLTGLLNRNAINHKLEDICSETGKSRAAASIVIFDLDMFDSLNQTYGHRFGDELLKRTANVLIANLGDQSIIGRFRGDEFLVILPDCRAETAFVLAEEVRKLIEDNEMNITIGRSAQSVRTTLSGGVATFPADANEPIDLVRKADEAMYRAKRTGRNRICLPSSAQMITKTSYYTQIQLERLAVLAKSLNKSEAFLLREALDDIFRKYEAGGQS